MNNYYLNGKNVNDYGIIPGQESNSNLALSGPWDMPSRIGKIYQEWPDENGLEPYLRADELFYGGRDLSFTYFLQGDSREEAMVKSYQLYDDINSFNGLIPFSSDLYGIYQVYVSGEISVEYLADGWCKGVIPMREPVVNLLGDLPTPDNGSPGIDNMSFESLGFKLITMKSQSDRPGIKAVERTAYGYEAAKIGKATFREFDLTLAIIKPSYTQFKSAIQGLMHLLSRPGARTLDYNNIKREFFAKDGFKVTKMQKQGEKYVAVLEIKLSEIRVLETWNVFTDISGLLLTDKNGRTLTEILKMN
ncbi:hypothetical protein [Pedobacter antarcticus]|uniref:hypothetical protein n=1 Tax=Pedobacter antarcticus TaxID=34086 RepID=UPI00292E8624|nr:hypothetical protein [Pedobacter antarcticus]